jgi:hypothetical protein
LLDPEGGLDEQNETNNFSTFPFAIEWLNLGLVITPDKTEYEAGDVLTYTVSITYYGTLTPVPNLSGIEFYLMDLRSNEEVPNTRTEPQTGSIQGEIVGIITLPIEMSPGRYQVLAEFRGGMYSGDTPIAFEIPDRSGPLSPLLFAVIVIATIAGIVAVAAYFTMRRPKAGAP